MFVVTMLDLEVRCPLEFCTVFGPCKTVALAVITAEQLAADQGCSIEWFTLNADEAYGHGSDIGPQFIVQRLATGPFGV